MAISTFRSLHVEPGLTITGSNGGHFLCWSLAVSEDDGRSEPRSPRNQHPFRVHRPFHRLRAGHRPVGGLAGWRFAGAHGCRRVDGSRRIAPQLLREVDLGGKAALVRDLFVSTFLVIAAHDGFRSIAMLLFPGLLLLAIMLLRGVDYFVVALRHLADGDRAGRGGNPWSDSHRADRAHALRTT